MFSTKIDIPEYPFKIDYTSPLLLMGSCFSENIGARLQQLCFDVDINPFGVLFNPASICQNITHLIENNEFKTDDLFQYNSLWSSYMHSTIFSDTNAVGALEKINSRFTPAINRLKKLQFIVLTFGTSWVYKLSDTGKIVANCHKVPASEFVRERLSATEIFDMYSELIQKLSILNPDLKIIITVSPVRHWKDGATENNISKGILLEAAQRISKAFPAVFYFPSYEIVVDELRDYRFYAADMLHPSELAVDYIFKQFSSAFFTKNTMQCIADISKYKNAIQHRPIHFETPHYRKFAAHLVMQKQELLNKYPFLIDRI